MYRVSLVFHVFKIFSSRVFSEEKTEHLQDKFENENNSRDQNFLEINKKFNSLETEESACFIKSIGDDILLYFKDLVIIMNVELNLITIRKKNSVPEVFKTKHNVETIKEIDPALYDLGNDSSSLFEKFMMLSQTQILFKGITKDKTISCDTIFDYHQNASQKSVLEENSPFFSPPLDDESFYESDSLYITDDRQIFDENQNIDSQSAHDYHNPDKIASSNETLYGYGSFNEFYNPLSEIYFPPHIEKHSLIYNSDSKTMFSPEEPLNISQESIKTSSNASSQSINRNVLGRGRNQKHDDQRRSMIDVLPSQVLSSFENTNLSKSSRSLNIDPENQNENINRIRNRLSTIFYSFAEKKRNDTSSKKEKTVNTSKTAQELQKTENVGSKHLNDGFFGFNSFRSKEKKLSLIPTNLSKLNESHNQKHQITNRNHDASLYDSLRSLNKIESKPIKSFISKRFAKTLPRFSESNKKNSLDNDDKKFAKIIQESFDEEMPEEISGNSNNFLNILESLGILDFNIDIGVESSKIFFSDKELLENFNKRLSEFKYLSRDFKFTSNFLADISIIIEKNFNNFIALNFELNLYISKQYPQQMNPNIKLQILKTDFYYIKRISGVINQLDGILDFIRNKYERINFNILDEGKTTPANQPRNSLSPQDIHITTIIIQKINEFFYLSELFTVTSNHFLETIKNILKNKFSLLSSINYETPPENFLEAENIIKISTLLVRKIFLKNFYYEIDCILTRASLYFQKNILYQNDIAKYAKLLSEKIKPLYRVTSI